MNKPLQASRADFLARTNENPGTPCRHLLAELTMTSQQADSRSTGTEPNADIESIRYTESGKSEHMHIIDNVMKSF